MCFSVAKKNKRFFSFDELFVSAMVDAFEPGDHIIRRRFGVLELGKGDGCCAQSWGSRGGVGFLPLKENRSDFSRFSMVVCIVAKDIKVG